jgi:hypothetical protein
MRCLSGSDSGMGGPRLVPEPEIMTLRRWDAFRRKNGPVLILRYRTIGNVGRR